MRNNKIVKNIDWILVLIYLLLAIGGLFSIYSALYVGESQLPQRLLNQIAWITISLLIGLGILLIDFKIIYKNSYLIYISLLVVMIGVMFFGKEVNGAKSWIAIGSFAVQPAEFMKLATSLALARYMSSYSFDMRRLNDFVSMAAIIALPFLVILLQNDTGSALVYTSFLLMLYREGLTKWIYIAGLSAITIFIMSFLIEPFALISALIILPTIANGIKYGRLFKKILFIIILYLVYFTCHFFLMNEAEGELQPHILLLIIFGLSLPLQYYYSLFSSDRSAFKYLNYIVSSFIFYLSINYVFENILQLHQRKRILDLLGIESDIFGWGYNVNQSKIAIGSGELFGKGLFNGTQTKYNFVPEQSTDFIFCTVGEEFGFLGTATIVILFALLIMRLVRMGEQFPNPFSRIYCYCIASVIMFHVVINIGMTIGIAPVIGIPLPFFSYGGSSFLAFTIMLAIALKLNMDNMEKRG